jgi:hypothetical protein
MMKPLFASLAVALAAAAAGAAGDAQAQPANDQRQVRQIIVYGTDPCPPSADGEIIICARRPETERYRIPGPLREPEPGPQGESWAERAEALEMVGRGGIQSCSPVGPGGASGCMKELIDKSRDERRVDATNQSTVP